MTLPVRSPGFSRAIAHAPDTTERAGCYAASATISPVKLLPWSRRMRQLEQTTLAGVRAGVPGLTCVAANTLVSIECTSWFRNFSRIPFRVLPRVNAALATGLRLSLRIDSPMTKHCSHGTFLHVSLQSSHLNICYYHQDLHQGSFHRTSRYTASILETPAPAYSPASR